jgi:hypothetical protein
MDEPMPPRLNLAGFRLRANFIAKRRLASPAADVNLQDGGRSAVRPGRAAFI